MREASQNERMVKPRPVIENGPKQYCVMAAIERGHHWLKQIHNWITTDGKTAITYRQVRYALNRLEAAGEIRLENGKWIAV